MPDPAARAARRHRVNPAIFNRGSGREQLVNNALKNYTPEQQKTITKLIQIGRRRGESRREILSALATGKVEFNFNNRGYGDSDSQNWRQERAQGYADDWAKSGGPLNLRASINRFYDETSQLDRGQRPGELAADVQRPREDLRGRYAEEMDEARALLRAVGGGAGGGRGGARGALGYNAGKMELEYGTQQTEVQDPELKRQQFFANWMAQKNPNSPLVQLGVLNPNMATTKTVSTPIVTGFDVKGEGFTGGRGSPRKVAGGAAGRAVAEAAKRIGVAEVNGSNRGPKIDSWQRKYGMLGQPWCGIFVGLSLEKAGVKGVTSRVASVDFIEQDARAGKNGFSRFLAPKFARPGDALITRKAGHVGLVERVDRDGTIHTIEGNTGNGAVLRRTHAPGSVYGVARPRYRR